MVQINLSLQFIDWCGRAREVKHACLSLGSFTQEIWPLHNSLTTPKFRLVILMHAARENHYFLPFIPASF